MTVDEELILDSVCVETHPSISASPYTYVEYTLLKELETQRILCVPKRRHRHHQLIFGQS
eukprot:gene16341-17978_t